MREEIKVKTISKIILIIFSLFFVIECSSEDEKVLSNLVEEGTEKKQKNIRIERNGVVVEIRGSGVKRSIRFKKASGSQKWKEMKDLRFKGFKGADSDSLPAFPDELKKEKPGVLKDLSFSKGKFQVVDLDGDMWVSANGEDWTLEQFGGGDGSEKYPYLVANEVHLWNVRYYLESRFKQTEDIDLKEVKDFKPIGFNPRIDEDDEKVSVFEGTFDGGGKKIQNLKINIPGSLGSGLGVYIGLFKVTSIKAVLKDIHLVDVNIVGRNYVGALAGTNEGLIENSSASGLVSGRNQVGGLVGDNNTAVEDKPADRPLIQNSHVTVEVKGNSLVGGFMGNNTGQVKSSSAGGKVIGGGDPLGFSEGHQVGGFVGMNTGGEISGSHATGEVEGKQDVGGFVGYNARGTGTGVIDSSYATGAVTDTADSGAKEADLAAEHGKNMALNLDFYLNGLGSTGGFAGHNRGIIRSSYATGQVKGYIQVGGFVGYNGDDIVFFGTPMAAKGEITGSYASGEVEGRDGVGGLVGDNQGDIEKSYAEGLVEGEVRVGGLIGYNEGAVKNTYATGEVKRTKGNKKTFGGLVGQLVGDVITETNYWLSDNPKVESSMDGVGGSDKNVTPITRAGLTESVKNRLLQ